MGASNALAAYNLYADRLSPLPLTVLVYMALISRDHDDQPWYNEGHATLAARALGRQEPITSTDLRAVERAFTELHAAGAVTTARRSARKRKNGWTTARYVLHLDKPAVITAGSRPSRSHPTENVGRDSGSQTRRKTSGDPSFTPDGKRRVIPLTPDGKRRTEEEVREEESLSPRAKLIRDRLPGATPQEREMIISRVEAQNPTSFAAYFRKIPDEDLAAMLGDLRSGHADAAAGLRPQDLYPDRHTQPCRDGQHAKCSFDWCTCTCHPKDRT